MDIQFAVDADIQTLIDRAVSSEDLMVPINSILLNISQSELTLLELFNLLKPHLVENRKKAVKILDELLLRKKDFTISDHQLPIIIQGIVPSVLDLQVTAEAITVLWRITRLKMTQEAANLLIELFENPRFHPTSHRQVIRQQCYQILLEMCPKINSSKIIRCILDTTYDEKDPRNVFLVFKLYHQLIDHCSQIQPFASQIFQNLEAYYPIDFIGEDDEQHSTGIQQLIIQLDDCLTEPIFKEQCMRILTDKMVSPPIHQFLPTFQQYILKNDDATRVLSLIRRTLRSQFLEDPTCHNALVECICTFFQKTNNSYDSLVKILDSVTGQLDNFAFCLLLLKKLIKNIKIADAVRSYVIKLLLDSSGSTDLNHVQLLFSMAIAVLSDRTFGPIQIPRKEELNNFATQYYKQSSLSIFCLRLLMCLPTVSLSEDIRQNITQTIWNPSLDINIRKSYIDFISTVRDTELTNRLKEYNQADLRLYIGLSLQDAQMLQSVDMLDILQSNHSNKLKMFLLLKKDNIQRSKMVQIRKAVMKEVQKEDDKDWLRQAFPGNQFYLYCQDLFTTDKTSQMVQQLQQYYGHTKPESRIGRIRTLDLEQILRLKEDIRSLKNFEEVLDQLTVVSELEYPTMRQLIAEYILPVLLQHAQNGINHRYLFLMLKTIPLKHIRAINQRIIQVTVSQLADLSKHSEIFQLCLDILLQFQQNIKEEQLEKHILPVCLDCLKTDESMKVLTKCLQMLMGISRYSFAKTYQKSVTGTVKELLDFRKRMVRQAAAGCINKWLNI